MTTELDLFSTVTPAQRHATLAAEIKQHDDLYFQKATPIISDFAYDRLVQQLKEIETQHPALRTAASPSQNVGEQPTKGFAVHQHASPMLSLDKAYTEEEVRNLITRAQNLSSVPLAWTIEPKVDGLAVALIYNDGQLQVGSTRGDGVAGDNITANLKVIHGVPHCIDAPGRIEIRGEVYLAKADFHSLNSAIIAAGEEPFANPRNAAAGSLKLHNSAEVAHRRLRFLAYQSEDLAPRPICVPHTQNDRHRGVCGGGKGWRPAAIPGRGRT